MKINVTKSGGRDKARDDKFFNCSQEHEFEQVAQHYGNNKNKVIEFLKENCKNGTMKYFTHIDVYKLIKEKLGYQIPI